MAKFIFKLDSLLKARKRREELVQRRVATIERQRLELEEKLRGLQKSIVGDKAEWRDRLDGTLDMHGLRLQANTALHGVRRAHQTVLALAGVHQRLDVARQELIETSRHRRALELVRERRLALFRAARERAETAALDDLANQRAARKEQQP